MSDVTSFEVTGDWRHIVDDGMVDLDDLPDEALPTGTVKFTPVFPSVATAGVPATAYTFGQVPALIAGGVLTDLQGRPGIRLAGKVGEHTVRWNAEVSLTYQGQKVAYPSPVAFELTEDTVLSAIIQQAGRALSPIVLDPRIEALAGRLADVDQVVGQAEQIVEDAGQSVIAAKGHADRAEGLAGAQDEHVADVLADPASATHAAFKAVGNATYGTKAEVAEKLDEATADSRYALKGEAGSAIPTTDAGVAEQLATILDLGSGSKRIAVLSDSTGNDSTDWVRVWWLLLGQHAPTSLRRVWHAWNAATNVWSEAIDAPGTGEGTPASGGVVLTDNFNRTAADLVGTTTSGGQVWTGAAGTWAADGQFAQPLAVGASLTFDAGSKDSEVTAVMNVVTTAAGAGQSVKVYAAATSPTSLKNGVWAQLGINASGTAAITLWKTINNANAQLGTVSGHGIIPDSATPVTVTLSLQVDIQNVTLTTTVDGGVPIVTTATVTESDYTDGLGTYVGLSSANGSNPGLGVDSITAETPYVPPVLPDDLLEIWNGSQGGARFSTFADAKIGQMFPPATVGDIDVLIVGSGHNHGTQDPAAFIAEMEAAISRFRTFHPDVTVMAVSQNPQFGTANATAHLKRQAALREWARTNGVDYVPVMEHFMGQADGGQSWVLADGIHPTTGASGATEGDFGAIQWAKVATSAVTGRMLRPDTAV